MESFFKAKNKTEATSQIWERLEMIPENLRTSVLSLILRYSSDERAIKKYPMSVKCHERKPECSHGEDSVLRKG